MEVPLFGEQCIQGVAAFGEQRARLVQGGGAVAAVGRGLLVQLCEPRARVMLSGEQGFTLRREVSAAPLPQLDGGLFARDELAQACGAGVAFTAGTVDLGDRPSQVGETPFVRGTGFGGLIECVPRILLRVPCFGSLSVEFHGAMVEDVRVVAAFRRDDRG